MTMRIAKFIGVVALGLAGCAGGTDVGSTASDIRTDDLPACASVAAPEEAIAVEDVGASMIVHVAGTPLCSGSLDDLARWGLHRTPSVPADPEHKADSDPMPADGDHPANSDPMPATGPAASDPMPADGRHPTNAATNAAPIKL